MIIGAIMALCFAYQFTVLLPAAGIGWQAHIGGLAGGVAAGWIFRDRRPKAAKPDLATGTAGLSFPGTQPGVTRRPGDPGSAP
jgi:membrane associated rhomboid family serine protease